MEKIHEIGLLLDFYGSLLTDKQYEALDLHYNNDYSLSEIAEHFNISRQGVHDIINRAKQLLYGLEEKLLLVKKFSEQKHTGERILEYIKSIDVQSLNEKDRKTLAMIEEGIIDIISKFYDGGVYVVI